MQPGHALPSPAQLAAVRERPPSLGLLPLVIAAADWRRIEAGVLQRMRLLDRIMADVYGPQALLARNLLPPALVHGHPGYLRPLHGVRPPGGTYLHMAAFDLARDAAGSWWVMAQRTQAPSGLGRVLENRASAARLLPGSDRELRTQGVAGTYRAFLDAMRSMCPGGGDPRIVLLTPSPHLEAWLEHAWLARQLGLTLAEGSDLTVRGDRLYLKTLRGLEPVHGVLNRLDDGFLDPLELRADSRVGVPGLVQAIRAGHVLVANAPGSAFLESAGLLGFLPAIAQHTLGEELLLPSVATWWCGERAALQAALPELGSRLVRRTYAGGESASMPGASLPAAEVAAWRKRIEDDPDQYTIQSVLAPPQMPTWNAEMHGERIVARPYLLRVFALAQGPGTWRVVPGGLARIAGDEPEAVAPLGSGLVADAWVLADDDTGTLEDERQPNATPEPRTALTSRAAENLFWIGRYAQRTANTARVARLALATLADERPASPGLLAWLTNVSSANGLVARATPAATQSRGEFGLSLLAGLCDPRRSASVAFSLRALRNAASQVREHLSCEQWNVIDAVGEAFSRGCADDGVVHAQQAARALEALLEAIGKIADAQPGEMKDGDESRLLSIGRHLERLGFLASAVAWSFETGSVFDERGFEAVVRLFGSANGGRPHDVPALVATLVLGREDSRSLAWAAQDLRDRIAELAASNGEAGAIALDVPDLREWPAGRLCERDEHGRYTQLDRLMRACADAAYRLSDALGARYFNHPGVRLSLGA